MKEALRQIRTLWAGLPEWFAWRLDAFATIARDRGLSPVVQDAIREQIQA